MVSGEKWGKRVSQAKNVMENVAERRIASFQGSRGNKLAKGKVLLFCLKHPKMKFTPDCIGVSQEINKAVLEEEIRSLAEQGIIGKHMSASGATFYYANKTAQELAKLIEVLS